jgi:hypothetical protein
MPPDSVLVVREVSTGQYYRVTGPSQKTLGDAIDKRLPTRLAYSETRNRSLDSLLSHAQPVAPFARAPNLGEVAWLFEQAENPDNSRLLFREAQEGDPLDLYESVSNRLDLTVEIRAVGVTRLLFVDSDVPKGNRDHISVNPKLCLQEVSSTTLWIPLLVDSIGKSFVQAWYEGAHYASVSE